MPNSDDGHKETKKGSDDKSCSNGTFQESMVIGPVIACDNNAHPVTDPKREADDELKDGGCGSDRCQRACPRNRPTIMMSAVL